MSICKRIGLISIITTLLLCSFPIFTFADDTIYHLPIDEPPVNDNSGYLVLYMEDYYNSTIHEVWCITWTLFQSNSTISFNKDIHNQVFLDEDLFTIYNQFDNDQSSGYLVVNVATSNGEYFNLYNGHHVSNDYLDIDFYDEGRVICRGYRGFVGNSQFFPSVEETDFNYVWNSESNLFSKLDDLISYIDTLESLDSQQLAQLKSIVSALGSVNINLTDIEVLLDSIGTDVANIYSLLNDVLDELESINSNTDNIENLLTQILNAINKTGDSFVDESVSDANKDTTDDYYSKSDGLTNKDTSNEFGSVGVDGSSKAFSEIWDYVDNFVNSHSKVFGLYAAILSVGIIALILNR